MNISIVSKICHFRWFPSLLAGIALSCAASLGAESVKPNIVFVLADDLGWGDLSCHGSEFIRTPHIDRLAREGADFCQFYTTSPVCSPSRVSFLTGQFPGRFSIHSALGPFRFAAGARRPPWLEARLRQADWLDPQATSLPRPLQQAGYVTGLFGKWHLRSAQASDAPGPTAYGLDEYALFRARNEEAPPEKTVTHETVWDASLEFIRRHRDRPFFVNVWIHEPHLAHFPSEESLKANAHLDQQRQVYAAVVTDADRGVGRILEVLDELDLAENTIVVFASDNGPANTHPTRKTMRGGYGGYYSVGSTGGKRGRKGSLYDGGTGVPLIVRWPGRVPAGHVDRTTLLAAVDLLPTLCAAAGAAVPEQYSGDGINALAAWKGTPLGRDRPLFWQWPHTEEGNPLPANWPHWAIRDGDWKLLTNDDGSRVELYRLPDDPAEENDLAAKYPDRVQRLLARLAAWRASLPAAPSPDVLSELRDR